MNEVDWGIITCDILSGAKIEDGKITNIREGTIYEFKENFNWNTREKYARIMASFANSVGGCIIFGVNDTGVIVGINNDNFEQKDAAQITEYLNSIFVPKIEWKKDLCTINDKKIGILYVEESNDKPIIACANGNEVKEGDIYYRYPGETRRIKQGELKSIIDEGKRKYGMKLLEEMKLIVEEGPKDFGVLDLEQIANIKDKPVYLINSGSKGKKVEVREAGQTDGSNGIALKVFNLEGPAKVIKTTESLYITSEMIVHYFLDGGLPVNYNPKGLLERLPYETSGLVPIYFYIKMANISKEDAIKIFKDSKSTTRGRSTILKRLSGEEYNFSSLTNDVILDNLINGTLSVSDLQTLNVKTVLQSIRSRSKSSLEQNWNALKDIMLYLYDEYYMNPKFRSEVRWTICFMDATLFSSLV